MAWSWLPGRCCWLEKVPLRSSIRPEPALSRMTAPQGKRDGWLGGRPCRFRVKAGSIWVGIAPGLGRSASDPPNRRNWRLEFWSSLAGDRRHTGAAGEGEYHGHEFADASPCGVRGGGV